MYALSRCVVLNKRCHADPPFIPNRPLWWKDPWYQYYLFKSVAAVLAGEFFLNTSMRDTHLFAQWATENIVNAAMADRVYPLQGFSRADFLDALYMMTTLDDSLKAVKKLILERGPAEIGGRPTADVLEGHWTQTF